MCVQNRKIIRIKFLCKNNNEMVKLYYSKSYKYIILSNQRDRNELKSVRIYNEITC